ncbi:MAG: hypothetical protein LBC09_07575 [Helicobacteraceae bacterium]|nr:hypothetical protein [Helicobacteraceae bacterium]
MIVGAMCVGIAVQIACASDALETLVGSEGLDGYTKYAIFSFYGKRGGADEAAEQTQNAPVTNEAETQSGASQPPASDAYVAPDETPDEAYEEDAEEPAADETPAIDAEPQAATNDAPAQSAAQPQERPAAASSQFYGDYEEEQDCGDYCK